MELNLQPLAAACFVSGTPFVDGDRVASHLVRAPTLEIRRCDVLAARTDEFTPPGVVACRWSLIFKNRPKDGHSDRALKLTAENLFLTLADPLTEPTPENARLLQFLALMLERKKVLRLRGRTGDGSRNRLEHMKSRQMFEIPADDLTPAFFVAIQEQLSVLVGEPKPKAAAALPAGAASG